MVWRRKGSEAAAGAACCVLADSNGEGRMSRGYVPMVVGEGEDEERFVVHVRLLKEPCMAALLEMAEEQYGHCQQGVLRLPCDARRFEQMVSETCKAR